MKFVHKNGHWSDEILRFFSNGIKFMEAWSSFLQKTVWDGSLSIYINALFFWYGCRQKYWPPGNLILPRKYWPALKINIWSIFPRKYQYFLYYRKYWSRLSDFCTFFIRLLMQRLLINSKNYSHGSITSQLCISQGSQVS